MKNTFGNSIAITLFGESHGDAIGAVIDGIAPGIKIDSDYIRDRLSKRQANGDISTSRKEADEPIFLSGIKDGYTEGTPIALIINNTNKQSSAYSALENTPRPSHADYTAECKYHGYQDKRGGGHFSGRITAALVAAGAILSSALEKKGIYIGTHIKSLHGVKDREFGDLYDDVKALNSSRFPALDSACADDMINEIRRIKAELNSVGGVLETAVIGVPAGIGEPWFDTVESMISHILFAIPGVKGVEFGDGFAITEKTGIEANDPLAICDGRIVTEKNSNGGINGGITNGMPIIFRTAIKPTPSISAEQKTVDMTTMEEKYISIGGRHDPAIIHRARAVVDACAAIAIADLLTARYGTDYLA